MTDTVKHTEIVSGYFIAMIQRTSQLVYGNDSVGLSESVFPGDYWYIVSELEGSYHVYFQRELNLNTVESSWLSYRLPLEEGICWESDPETAKLLGCNTLVKSFGFPDLSTGDMIGCYTIQVGTFVGGGSSLFCPGVGIGKRSFGLHSTAIGSTTSPPRYEEILIDYGQKP